MVKELKSEMYKGRLVKFMKFDNEVRASTMFMNAFGKNKKLAFEELKFRIDKKDQHSKQTDAFEKMKEKRNFSFIGRRWFSTNTYHSVEVYMDGKLVGYEPFTYGYGDQYEVTGFKILKEKGIKPFKDMDFTMFRRYTQSDANRNKFVFSVTDVSRKKDL